MTVSDYGRLVKRSRSKAITQAWDQVNTVPQRFSRMVGRYPSNRSGYGNYGASQRKIANEAWQAVSGSADQDIVFNLPTLRVRSRDLFMGAPIAGAAILTLRVNTVGNGLIPIPQIDGEYLGMTTTEAATANGLIKNEFNLFADTIECDWNRRNTFYELTDLAFCNMAISGDVLGLLPMKTRRGAVYDTKIRMIEADRIANPDPFVESELTRDGNAKIYGGVELTDDGEVDAYWIAKNFPGVTGMVGNGNGNTFTRVPAFGAETGRPVSVLVSEMERPEQRRGVPLMAKCLTELKQLQRYIESTTIQNVIKSYFTAFVESAMPSSDMFDRLISEEDIEDLIVRNKYDVRLAPGIINWMRAGDSIKFPINAGPEAQFEPYVVALCKFIGACLGIPYEVLLKQFNASYSASRAALLEFWRRVKVLRKLMVNQWCQPIYVVWMMEAIAKGVWKAPGFFEDPRIFQAWTKCAWSGSSPGSIDPLKEILAAEHKVRMGVSTLEMECLEFNGSDWRATTTQQGIERAVSTQNGLTYIRNLDARGIPVTSLGISEEFNNILGDNE
jgi:lambda family phage portal protein